MKQEQNQTLQKIHASAIKEFQEKGFNGASLRNIVKQANVTTGAFYGYYDSKEALFDALVGPHAEALMGMYDRTLESFEQMPPEEQEKHIGDMGDQCMREMIHHCYTYPEECLLLFTAAAGTRYEHFQHELTVKEIDSTHSLMNMLEERGYPVRPIDEKLEHIIISGMFAGMIEPLIHQMDEDEAIRLTGQLHEFYTAGWLHMMGVSQSDA